MNSQELMELTQSTIMTTYGRYPVALVKGEGIKAWDADGKEYLDFLGGIAVNLLGHSHPAVAQAIAEQAKTLIHCSNLYYTQPAAELAALLVANGGLDKVFFCNSGAEANEGAFKLVRKYHWRKGNKQKTKIISLSHSFHGRTMGALAATAKPEIQEGFTPLPAGFSWVEGGDLAALKAAVDSETAAVIIEPVQGEGGIYPFPADYLKAVRSVCDETGALLIFDEIQCGLGRTGSFFAYQGVGVRPDIITLAKGLAGGLPMGAFCATAEVAAGFQPGDHGTTFGGNPVCAAAALATLKTVLNTGLVAQAARVGNYLVTKLSGLVTKYPSLVKQVRGAGLMVGMELKVPGAPILAKCHELGLLANVTAGTVFRMLPPFTVTEGDVDQAVAIVDQALAAVTQ